MLAGLRVCAGWFNPGLQAKSAPDRTWDKEAVLEVGREREREREKVQICFVHTRRKGGEKAEAREQRKRARSPGQALSLFWAELRGRRDRERQARARGTFGNEVGREEEEDTRTAKGRSKEKMSACRWPSLSLLLVLLPQAILLFCGPRAAGATRLLLRSDDKDLIGWQGET